MMDLPSRKADLASVHIDIVGGCQLRCVGCPNATLLPDIQHVPVEKFEGYLRNIDVQTINIMRLFNYGEPLLHKDLPGILRAVMRQSYRIGVVEISTNAQFTRWDQIEEVLRLKRINRLAVSCDGDGTPASFERMRPPAKWSKLIAFLDRMSALRDAVDPDLELITRTVVFEADDMDRWRAVLEPRGWTPEFRPFQNLVDGVENLSGWDPVPGTGACQFVRTPRLLYVDWDGSVVPCCAHPRASVLGSLATHKWSEIVRAEARAKFLEMMATDRSAHPVCGRCEYGSGKNPGTAAETGWID